MVFSRPVCLIVLTFSFVSEYQGPAATLENSEDSHVTCDRKNFRNYGRSLRGGRGGDIA